MICVWIVPETMKFRHLNVHIIEWTFSCKWQIPGTELMSNMKCMYLSVSLETEYCCYFLFLLVYLDLLFEGTRDMMLKENNQ